MEELFERQILNLLSISRVVYGSCMAAPAFKEIFKEVNRIPEPPYEDHPAYAPLGKPHLMERVKALLFLSPYLLKSFLIYLRWGFRRLWLKNIQDPLKPDQYGHLQELTSNGAIAWRLSDEDIQNIRIDLSKDLSQLEENRKLKKDRNFRENQLAIQTEDTAKRVENLLRARGILGVAEHYCGFALRIESLALQMNDTEDTSFWKSGFVDLKLPYPQTSYMHIDSACGGIKALLYLSEVSESTGPFSFVLESHRFKRSFGELMIRKAMDISGLDSRGLGARKIFRALPKFLQKKAAFGYDLMTNQFESTYLLQNEKKFLSHEGNLILFDYNGIHRGAMVQKGYRIILQILMGAKS